MTNNDYRLVLKNVSKSFGEVHALRNVDFVLGQNEVVGLLGDNGAGKSTLIKIITGYYQPTEGEIYFNGQLIDDEAPFALGSRLGLGPAGPVLYFAELDGVAAPEQSSQLSPDPIAAVSAKARTPKPTLRSPRRSFGGKGATIFFKDMFEESTRKSKSRLRWVIWVFVVLLVCAVGGVYWLSEIRVRRTEVQLEEQARLLEVQQARADSLMLSARAEVDRLDEELIRAREGAAPAAVLDSLRQALADAGARTDALEEALVTAQRSLDRELAMGDSLRRQAQADLARVRAELGRAQGRVRSGVPKHRRRLQPVRPLPVSGVRAGAVHGRLRLV